MAIRSKDYISIAHDIRKHESSAMSTVEELRSRTDELSGGKHSLIGRISALEASIESSKGGHEPGERDDVLALLEEKSTEESTLASLEQELESVCSQLEAGENELAEIEEQKERTLREIHERAQKTSRNITQAGLISGAFTGVGSALGAEMQESLSALSDAASILGSEVGGVSTAGTAASFRSAGATRSGAFRRTDIGCDPITAQPTSITDRSHDFFSGFITQGSVPAADRPREPSPAHRCSFALNDTLAERFRALKDLPVKSLTKSNLDTLVDIAVTNLRNLYQYKVPYERFAGLAGKIHFVGIDEVKKDIGSGANYICGYYIPYRDIIKINLDGNSTVGDMLATIDHEAMHLLSTKPSSTLSGVKNASIIYRNVGMNEGLTEMYSIRNMKSVHPGYVSHCYTSLVAIMTEFEKACGESELQWAYLNSDSSKIAADYNRCMNDQNAFLNLCNDIDIVHHYTYTCYSAESRPKLEAAKTRIYAKIEQYKRAKHGYRSVSDEALGKIS